MKLAALRHLVRSAIAKARHVEGSELVGVCRSPSVRWWCDADRSKADAQSFSVVPFKLQVAGELGPFANLADAGGPFIDGSTFHPCAGLDVSTARSRSHTWRARSASFGAAWRQCRSDR